MKHRELVSRIMSSDVKCVKPLETLFEARELMDRYGFRHVPVLDDKDVVGMLSRTDIMRASYGLTRQEEETNKEVLQMIRVDSAMTREPVVITSETTIHEAAELISELDISALPVLRAGELVGIVTSADLIKYLLEKC